MKLIFDDKNVKSFVDYLLGSRSSNALRNCIALQVPELNLNRYTGIG